jgi:mannose-6-phosphate isomerase-like protein (cupin superfamily)
MRRLSILIAGLVLYGSTWAFAQDPFAGVSKEPRPSEYLFWTAEDYESFKTALQEALADGPGIFGTQFVYQSALPEADYRPHNIQIIHRSGYTQPEIHELKWDIYVILDGSGTARVGGERSGWIEGRPVEEQRPGLEGAQEFQVNKGDMLHIPARVWHQVVTDPDQSITYALINIYE